MLMLLAVTESVLLHISVLASLVCQLSCQAGGIYQGNSSCKEPTVCV